ncbi:hypothetical protein niasHT_000873 [Heterodera trifolii]|uniref:Annexin n=1 Tax=Heterodera trifolii TaxID=157864 RepID=A0ABD2M8T7_9BILA
MPNPLSSAVNDIVTNSITNKILGGNKKADNTYHHQQQNKSSSAAPFGGGLLGKISSTIASAVNSTNQQHYPSTQPQQMSSGGYNNQSNYPGGAYPQQYGNGNTGNAGGYPPAAPPSAGAYPPQQYGGIAPPYGTAGGYPPQYQPTPYPTSTGGYAPSSGASIGFNIDAPSAGGGGYPPYQPNLGGGGAPVPSPYPQQTAPYQQPPYHTTGGGGAGAYPTQTFGSQPQQTAYGGGAGFGYPQMQQHGHPQQQQHLGGISQASAMSAPSIRANPNFNAQMTAELLRKAMKGFGCDKSKVIQALVNCNNAQRQEVIRTFKQMYGKELIPELKSELTGDFEHLIIALMELPAVYDAAQLRRSMEGLGTKEHILIEVMTTRPNAQIYAVKMAYRQMYNSDLERDIVGETSGYFQRLLISLCSGARDEQMHTDPIKANQDAQRLWRAGEARLGTDEIAFNSILAVQNFAQLRLVFDEYQRQHGHSIEQAISNEFSGDIRDANLALVKSIRNRAAYFAELLHNSMKGIGTRDTDLIRLVVTRSEVDMADIRQAYQNMYGTPLENAIASDCSGAYKDGLVAIVKGYYH